MLRLDDPESSAARSMVTAGFNAPMGALTSPPGSPWIKFAILAPTIARSAASSRVLASD